MVSRRNLLIGGGLAGIVLAGAVGRGINSNKPERKQEEYNTQQENSIWQTVEEFDGFTYVSPDKLTRKEVEANLRTPPCSHDDELYFRDNGLPSPERRQIITGGLYQGQSIGINRKYDERGTTLVYSIIDEKIANRVLQVEVYPDGSRNITKISGKSYNEEEFNKLVKEYSK